MTLASSQQNSSANTVPKVICLMGATATGKTGLAVAMVEQLNAELISVDSALIYKGMDIGTAKPDADVLAVAPHHLIDICDPAESYSAAQFRDDAMSLIQQIHEKGKLPVLVGGTMLYFKALLEGMANLPEADANIRKQLLEDAENKGWGYLHERLQQVDPVSAKRIHPNDPQRLQRALEVYLVTGRSLTEFWLEQEAQKLPFESLQLALEWPDRKVLHERIALRFQLMMEQGFEKEVRGLYERGDLHADLPSIRCVGYRQMWDYIEGRCSHDEMIERGVIATRQLAKRQLTWLRKWPQLNRIDASQDKPVSSSLKLIKDYLYS